jgi:hypothetical protein
MSKRMMLIAYLPYEQYTNERICLLACLLFFSVFVVLDIECEIENCLSTMNEWHSTCVTCLC